MPRLEASELLATLNVAMLSQPVDKRFQAERRRAIAELERRARGNDSTGKRSGVDLAKMSPAARSQFLGNFGIKAVDASKV